MTSNREIEKLFDQWNPNNVRAGDRVQVKNNKTYSARVVGLELDIENEIVYANLRLLDNTKSNPIRVDVKDCHPASSLYPGHHTGG